MTIEIHPDNLLFHIVSTLPGMERLTELDRLVLAGLVCFATPTGVIDLDEKKRKHIREGLQLSMSGFANVLYRLMKQGMITRGGIRNFRLTLITAPLIDVPKQLTGEFMIKFVTKQ